jgi:4-alpha-glucanotransferase
MATRACGILLHPTSLPSRFGIGDLGPEADRFLDWLAGAQQTVWQILPLGPTGFGDSPYNTSSAFAATPLLISPEILFEEGLVPPDCLDDAPESDSPGIDFAQIRAWKEKLLRESWRRFSNSAPAATRRQFEEFQQASEQAPWLSDWALFAALRLRYEGRSWTRWPEDLRQREPRALRQAARELTDETALQRYMQFLLSRQWTALKSRANRRGIRLLGDLPIYVAADSADVWLHPDFFDLDATGNPQSVAGVPPDFFSPTGQLWGNPVYRWERLRQEGFSWWVERLRRNLELTDLVRLDHFRGFAAYWKVPASAPDASQGSWCAGPGRELFDAFRTGLGRDDIPLIAEDLGLITTDVEALREGLGLPGMKVLQFAFGSAESDHLPHSLTPDTVVYTGTHDNDTVRGWFGNAGPEERQRALDYLGSDGREIHWDFIRAALTSVADLAVVPLQDVLGLGSEARLNRPGEPSGNWQWRLTSEQLTDDLGNRLRRLTELAGRAAASEHTGEIQGASAYPDAERGPST